MNQIEDIKYELYIQAASMRLQIHLDLVVISEALNALMDLGVYSDTFLEVLYPTHPYNMDEWYAIFNTILEYLECAMPKTEQEAKDSIVRYHLRQIVERKSNVFGEIYKLEDKLYNNDHDYSTMGAAAELYKAYYEAIISYPFNVGYDTDDELAELQASLYQVAVCCATRR